MSTCQHEWHAIVENRVLRKVCGHDRDEVRGEWRRSYGEELYEVYSLPNIISGDQIKKNEMGGACSAYGGVERGVDSFGGEIQRKEPSRKI
jgi:hypothetical protein